MTHEHHHHDHTVTSLNKAFIWGIALNVGFVVVEFAVGLCYGSMGLLSDAGHNLSDVASLLLAMLAFRLAQARATPKYTYGYKKSTVLISLLNSVILLIAVGVIVNVGSISATVASISRGEYCLSKAGVAMATKLFAVKMAEFGVPVYEIRPGVISSDMTSVVKEK